MTLADWINPMFDPPGALTPHGFCLAWEPALIQMMVVGDASIALAYLLIPIGLIVLQMRDLVAVPAWFVAMFSAFIWLCGLSHVMEIITLYFPAYWAEAIEKLVTGGVSLFVVVMMILTVRPWLSRKSGEATR